MGHSSDVHKLILSDDGISLVPMEADATAGPKQKERVGKSITGKTNINQKIKGSDESRRSGLSHGTIAS
jgi:hypothetical protein